MEVVKNTKGRNIGLTTIILLLLAFIAFVRQIKILCLFLPIDEKTIEYTLELPLKVESLETITLEQDKEKETIANRDDIKDIINILYGTERKTKEQSIQDFPFYGGNLILIHLKFDCGNIHTLFVYERNNEYFIEETYNGIYRISVDEYNSIKNYIRDSAKNSVSTELNISNGLKIDYIYIKF